MRCEGCRCEDVEEVSSMYEVWHLCAGVDV